LGSIKNFSLGPTIFNTEHEPEQLTKPEKVVNRRFSRQPPTLASYSQ